MLIRLWTAVDGGHRAIKYSRISGVKKEIYSEGMCLFVSLIQSSEAYCVCFI